MLSVLWCGAARAQGTQDRSAVENPPLAVTKQAADRLFQQGERLFLHDEFNRAAETFLAAYKLDSDPIFLCNAGRAYDRAGQSLQARQMYKDCLGGPLSPEERILAEQHLRRLSAADPPRVPLQPAALAVLPTDSPRPPRRALSPEPPSGLMPPPQGPAPPVFTPVYRRAWFWVVVGGATTAVIVSGAVVGTALAEKSPRLVADWGVVAVRFAP